MFANTLRKSLTLLAVYFIIIIGIFILQFKNDSIISEKLGALHITLSEFTAEDNTTKLNNKFTAIFNGINFYSGEENLATAVVDGKEVPLILNSWKKNSPLSCEFDFIGGTKLNFTVSDESNHAHLILNSTLPEETSSIYIPYKLTAGSSITQRTDSRIRISNKKNSWEFNTPGIEIERFLLTKNSPDATYAYFDNTRIFSFAMTTDIPAATETSYTAVLESLKTNIISAFTQSAQDAANITEQDAVSYIAVMAEKGRYAGALEATPAQVKNSQTRTFLSIPYFGSLVRLNELLQRQMQMLEKMIQDASENISFDVFSERYIADYMCIHPGSKYVNSLLTNVSQDELSSLTLQQAAGIINVYVRLNEKKSELSSLLLPAAEKALFTIEKSCTLDENSIMMSENGSFLSVIQAVQAGDALLGFGRAVSNQDYIAAGRLIIASYLKDTSAFDIHTLAQLYPVVNHANKYYPHFEILSFNAGRAVWAWTCAENISLNTDSDGTITIYVDFPVNNTHYITVSGISPFRSIYIYDVAFRTDPRFESYNSSGYVYLKESSSLLLKSRHRSRREEIRLIYKEPVSPKVEEIIETDVTSPVQEDISPIETDFSAPSADGEN